MASSPKTPLAATKRSTLALSLPATAARLGAGVLPQRRSLTDEAYSQLEELIVTLQLPPGAAVSEAMLAERLNIGRTPIREALLRLAREHLVLVLPQRGILVSSIDIKQQLRLLETRREVERLVARCAARRANPSERLQFVELGRLFHQSADDNDATSFIRLDKQFNDLCLSSARNEFAAGAMSLMQGLSRRFWYLHYRQAADLPVTARLHADTASAIGSGEEEAAGKALDQLLDNIESFTRATISTDV